MPARSLDRLVSSKAQVEFNVPDDEGSISPGAARRQLGAVLRELREVAGLRLEDAAQHLERSTATMSRLENGKLVPRVVDVRALLDHYERIQPGTVPLAVRDRVLVLAGDSRKQEWFSPFRDVIASDLTSDHIGRYVQFETDAREILSYEMEFIPGLLQTPDYARAVADLFYPEYPEAQRRRFVEFRTARQAVLTRKVRPVRFRVAIRELALQRPLGPPAVRAEQLRKIADELRNGMPNVEIRIVSNSLVIPEALRGPFVVMHFPGKDEDDLAYLEGRGGAEYLQNAAAVERYESDFETLWKESLSQKDSLTLVEEVLASIS